MALLATYTMIVTFVVLWLLALLSVETLICVSYIYMRGLVNKSEGPSLAISFTCALLSITYNVIHEIDAYQRRNEKKQKGDIWTRQIRTCYLCFSTILCFTAVTVAIVTLLQSKTCPPLGGAVGADLSCWISRSGIASDIFLLLLTCLLFGIFRFASRPIATSLFSLGRNCSSMQQSPCAANSYTDITSHEGPRELDAERPEKHRNSCLSFDTSVTYLSLPGPYSNRSSWTNPYFGSSRHNRLSLPTVEEDSALRRSSVHENPACTSTLMLSSTLLPLRAPHTQKRHESLYSDIPSISPSVNSKFRKRMSTNSDITVLPENYKQITTKRPALQSGLQKTTTTHSQCALPVHHQSCHSLSTPLKLCQSLTHHSLPDLTDDEGEYDTDESSPTPPPPSWYPKNLKHLPLTAEPAIRRLTEAFTRRLSSDQISATDLAERGSPMPKHKRTSSLLFSISEWPLPRGVDNSSSSSQHQRQRTQKNQAARENSTVSRPKRIWESEMTTSLIGRHSTGTYPLLGHGYGYRHAYMSGGLPSLSPALPQVSATTSGQTRPNCGSSPCIPSVASDACKGLAPWSHRQPALICHEL